MLGQAREKVRCRPDKDLLMDVPILFALLGKPLFNHLDALATACSEPSGPEDLTIAHGAVSGEKAVGPKPTRIRSAAMPA